MKRKILFFIVICGVLLGSYGIYHKYTSNIIFFRDIPVNKSDDKKDILLVHPNQINSGALVMLRNLSEILIKNNYSVYLMIFSDAKTANYFEDLGIPVVKVDKKFFRNAKTEEMKMFDLLIYNTYSMHQRWLENYHRFKSILWLHEMFPNLQGNMYYTNLTLNECFKDNNHKNFKNKVITVSELAYCNTKEIISMATRDNIIYNIIDDDIITTINDTSFNEQLKKESENRVVFSMIGRIDKYKKQDVLIEAINLLPDEYKKKSFFYIIGGIENKNYAQNLKIKELDNVRLIENVPYEKMGTVYANTDVLLHPSLIDASPLVILEAAANNIPSVITINVGSTHIVKDNESGFVIPVNNAEALKEKIMWFIDNQEQIEIMGKKANQYYKETSSKEIFKEKWLKLIKDVLSEEKFVKNANIN